MFFIFLILFVGFAYMFLMIYFSSGWKRMSEEQLTDENSELFISVVVAFKNESQNLPLLLKQLSLQTHQHFELIFINDHSTDDSAAMVQSFQEKLPQLILLQAVGNGKKAALKQAIASAKGDLIVTTDADCKPENTWLQAIAQFQNETKCDLIICPVKMSYQNSLFSKLQALEFTSLIVSGAGAAGVNMPIMCNGASLAFTPQAWKNADLKEKEVSGDDMFLLMSVKKQKGKIRFLKSKYAMVETTPCESVSHFSNQRQRWVSKSKTYTDFHMLGTAVLVFAINALILASLVLGFFQPLFWKTALLLFGIKTLVDASLLVPAAKFFGVEKLTVFIPFLQLIYPFYVVYMAVVGLFGRVRWK